MSDIHKKNSSVKVAETSYVRVSRGSLSIGEIKFWGKAVRGRGLIFVKCLRAVISHLTKIRLLPNFFQNFETYVYQVSVKVII